MSRPAFGLVLPFSAHHRRLALVFAVFLLLPSPDLRAGEIDDAEFGLRLTAAISRFSRYPDVAGMGGASAGSRWSSSVNPASTGWSPPVGENGWGLSLQGSGVLLEEGTRLWLFSESVAVDAGNLGVFQPALLQLRSNRATTRQDLDFEWDGLYAELQWGLKISDSTALGLNLNFLTSEMDFDMGSVRIARSSGETYAARAGVLWEQSPNLYLGAAIDYGVNPSKSKTYDFMGLGIGTTIERDTLHQFLFHPGLSWLVTEDLTITFDYQFGLFHDDTGTLRVHRFYAGFDQTLTEGVYLRAGLVADTEGNLSPSAGLGIAPSESVLIDLSWQRNLFPEIEEEFGDSNVLSLSLTLLF
jgi:hypothetical protein